MSVVRWSTPIELPDGVTAIEYYFDQGREFYALPTSDFYIYEHYLGFWSINLAGNRHRPTTPRPSGVGEDWQEWIKANREPIDHPEAGASYEFVELSRAIECVERLIGEGFLAPPWLLDEMRAELEGDNEQAE
jgi:hypothetical protein